MTKKKRKGCLHMINIDAFTFNCLDHIFIVDKNYKIVYNNRFDENINDASDDYISSKFIGRNFFDVYPEFRTRDSQIVECMRTGQTVIAKNQRCKDYLGHDYYTSSVAVPLMRRGTIIGVVELSMDVDEQDNVENSVSSQKFDEVVRRFQNDAAPSSFDTILTCDKYMKNTIEKTKLLADTALPILICGETGCGKEVFAQAIMAHRGVPKEKRVILNCAAAPENLIESILFGTVKGAYTGAENRQGLFEQADGGTLFLDELNSMPYTVQARLMRVLQDGTFRPLGGSHDKTVNVKVIAAMNVDPEQAVRDHILRKDLFYRFSGGLLFLKPLRERPDDIELFTSYYISYYGRMYNKKISGITQELRRIFLAYSWEGNVRELKNAVEVMVSRAEDGELLSFAHLPDYLQARIGQSAEPAAALEPGAEDGTLDYAAVMHRTEQALLRRALKEADGNRTKAAELLGLPRQTFNYKLRSLEQE